METHHNAFPTETILRDYVEAASSSKLMDDLLEAELQWLQTNTRERGSFSSYERQVIRGELYARGELRSPQ